MIFAFLTMLTALTISAVAIYYSVAGLVAIFAAAAIPIIIMGSALEVGKLVTAVWLHKYWHEANWWLKTYLSFAVVVLMFITSMGIFGFLSKAHIEQTAATQESVAQVERLDKEIARQEAVLLRAEQRIEGLESGNSGAQANIQAQIDREQERINSAYARIQPAIDEQNQIIQNKTRLFQEQIDKIDQDLTLLQGYINSGEIRKAQGMVGTRADGQYGPATAQAFTRYQQRKAQEREQLVSQLVALNSDPVIVAAREEIQRIRRGVETQIAQSNELINSLRQRLSNNESTNVETLVAEQNKLIRTTSSELDRLTQEKFAIEAEYRKLEAEVGPIKYIADFVYGEADKNTLEEAVRWVILIIIFVFDPLAVLLLIAAQYTFMLHQEKKQEKQVTRLLDEITKDEEPTPVDKEQLQRITDLFEGKDKEKQNDLSVEETDSRVYATVRKMDAPGDDSDNARAGAELEQGEVQADDRDSAGRPEEELPEVEDSAKKKDIEFSEGLKQTRTQELEEQENDLSWSEAKRSWKEENPDLTLKHFKEKYINGEIDHLPWEEYLIDDSKKKTYIMKQGSQQVRKTVNK